jgi:hypothetical protein
MVFDKEVRRMTDPNALSSQPLSAEKPQRPLRRGDVVHVKAGSPHSTYPDLPMGGWSGTVERIERQKSSGRRRCWVHFFDSTVARLHPVYEDRERRDNDDDCELWDNWVPQEQLEMGEAPPVNIEQPKLPPWAERAGDRQIRGLFNLGPDELYPECEPKTWQVWHRFLSEHLPLPRPLEDDEFDGEPRTLVRLLLPGDLPSDYSDDEEPHGLYGEVASDRETFVMPLDEITLPEGDPFDNLLYDYAYWYDAIHEGAGDWEGDLDDDFDNGIPFGLSLKDFERLWKSARKSVFESEFGIDLPDEADMETALSSLERRSQPVEEEPSDCDTRPEPIRAAPRVGRNDPCPCGSGKKYKKCCLRQVP